MHLGKASKILITTGLTAGAFIGSASLVGALGRTHASTPAPVSATGAGGVTAPASNEDPTHEATESAQREADEAAGKFPGGPGGPDGHGGPDGGFGGPHHSNTDPAHEAAESPARAAQEAADDAGQATSTTTPATTPTTVTPTTAA
jgi:hypothetical protein